MLRWQPPKDEAPAIPEEPKLPGGRYAHLRAIG